MALDYSNKLVVIDDITKLRDNAPYLLAINKNTPTAKPAIIDLVGTYLDYVFPSEDSAVPAGDELINIERFLDVLDIFKATNTGYQGYQGIKGYMGVQGSQGIQGPKGDDAPADAGAQGFTGYQGLQGSRGIQGQRGLQGYMGETIGDPIQGYQGYQGYIGYQGYQGLPSEAAVQGYQGTVGLQGETGYKGYSGEAIDLIAIARLKELLAAQGFVIDDENVIHCQNIVVLNKLYTTAGLYEGINT